MSRTRTNAPLIAMSIGMLLPALVGTGEPPATPKDPVTETLHGETTVDEYRWLESLEKDDPRVKEWTTSQLEYTRNTLDSLSCHAELSEELSKLMSIGSVGTPRMRGPYYFYTKRSGGQDQGVLMVNRSIDGEPRILLDPNTLDDDGLVSLDFFEPSHDGSLVAFGLSRAGDEMTTLHVLRTDSGQWLAGSIEGKVRFGGWNPSGSGFLYSRLSDPTDPYSREICWHELGRSDRHDPVLFTQEEPSRIPWAFLSRNGRWIVMGVSDGWSRNDLWTMDFNQWRRTGRIELIPVAVDLQGSFSPAGILGDTLYMTTSLEAPNQCVYAVDLTRPEKDQWHLVIPERKDQLLRGLSMARGMLIGRYTVDVTDRLERFDLVGTPTGSIELPGLGTASISTESDRTDAFIAYSSYNEPRTIYHVDLDTMKRSLWARPDVPVDVDSVIVTQEWATSPDGTRVPMFIIRNKDVKPTGENPCVLYGYGGFKISLTPRFYATNFPFYDKGGIYVVANLRGGGEFGEPWHRAGMLENKQNVFDDLYATCEHLFKQGWTNADHLAVMGGSNGGLLTGVAVTQRPELFTCAISAVPLLDMLRYHKFLMARFWIPEYGSPDDPEAYSWLRGYSPYQNVQQDREYPAVLLTAGENDTRVHPLHARKMAARLQEATGSDPDHEPILLWVDRAAGHGAGKPMSQRIQSLADQWSFLMWQTGICPAN